MLEIFFRGTGHKNYCLEAFNFLMQYHYTLTPRCAEQMLWFMSSEGGPGGNISADLHMEHLNRILKEIVNHLGANKTPAAIVRAAKALGPLKEIVAEFDKITGIWLTRKHSRRSEAEDLMKVVVELTQNEVFAHQPGRKHLAFHSIRCNGLQMSIKRAKFKTWMSKNAMKLIKKSPFTR